MVKINNPRAILKEKLLTMKEQDTKIQEFVRDGTLTQRLGDYIGQLMIIDYFTEELEVYTQLEDLNNAQRSLYQIRCQLDCVAAVLLADGPLDTERIGGLIAVKNIDLENKDKTKELYNLAKERYNQALIKFTEAVKQA